MYLKVLIELALIKANESAAYTEDVQERAHKKLSQTIENYAKNLISFDEAAKFITNIEKYLFESNGKIQTEERGN